MRRLYARNLKNKLYGTQRITSEIHGGGNHIKDLMQDITFIQIED